MIPNAGGVKSAHKRQVFERKGASLIGRPRKFGEWSWAVTIRLPERLGKGARKPFQPQDAGADVESAPGSEPRCYGGSMVMVTFPESALVTVIVTVER